MATFGLFNDEGLVEGDFCSKLEAEATMYNDYSLNDDLEVLECCPDHPDQPRSCCEECDAEEEADEAEDDD